MKPRKDSLIKKVANSMTALYNKTKNSSEIESDLPTLDFISTMNVMVIGGSKSGKKTFIQKACGEDCFSQPHGLSKKITIDKQEIAINFTKKDFNIYDQNESGISNMKAFIVIFDLETGVANNYSEELNYLGKLLSLINRYKKEGTPIILVGNKSDIAEKAEQKVDQVKNKFPTLQCISISATKDKNVDSVLTAVAISGAKNKLDAAEKHEQYIESFKN